MAPLQPLLFVAAFLLAGCHPTREAPSPSPPVPPDTNLCPQMCEHIGPKGLNCEEGKDYYDSDVAGPKGKPNATCETFCRTQQEKGVFINPRCVAQVPACPQIEEWRKKTCP